MLATYSMFLKRLGLSPRKRSVCVEKKKLDILMKDDILTMIISISIESQKSDPLTISGPRWICVQNFGNR